MPNREVVHRKRWFPTTRDAALFIAPSDASKRVKAQADYVCDGTDDSEEVYEAFARLSRESVYGDVVLLPGTHNWLATSSYPVSVPSNTTLRFDDAYVKYTGSSSAAERKAITVDGSSAKTRVGIAGKGRLELQATGANRVYGIYAAGDIQFLDLGHKITTSHTTDSQACTGALISGDSGHGVRDVVLGGMYKDIAYTSGTEEAGSVVIKRNVSRVTGTLQARRVNYGLTVWYNDLLPTAVYHNTNAKNQLFDGKIITNTATFTVSSGDYLYVGFARPVQALRVWIHSGNTTNLSECKVGIYNGTTWTTHVAVDDETLDSTHHSFSQGGEIVWEEPVEGTWGSGVVNGVTAYWLRIHFTDSNGASQGIGSVKYAQILGFEVPRDINLTGYMHDSANAGVHVRGGFRVTTRFNMTKIDTHGVNHNSHDTENLVSDTATEGSGLTGGTQDGGTSTTTFTDASASLLTDGVRMGYTINNLTAGCSGTVFSVTATTVTVATGSGALSGGSRQNFQNGDTISIVANDDRFLKSRWCDSYDVMYECNDTAFLSRCAKFGKFVGLIDRPRDSAAIEQGTGTSDQHKTIGYYYGGVVIDAGREAVRLVGDYNVVDTMILGAGVSYTLGASSNDRTGVKIKADGQMNDAKGNVIRSVIRGTLDRMRTGILAESGITEANYVDGAAIANPSVAYVTDSGGGLKQVKWTNLDTGVVTASSGFTGNFGVFGVTPIAQVTMGADLTNNVTAGGSNNVIANYTDLTTYANDAAAIRNNIYQLARSLKIIQDGLRDYGLLS